MAERAGRLGPIDGARGAAALVVLAHHALLTVPSLAAPYFSPVTPENPVARALVQWPLHAAWAGREAVYVFFVLSGFALVWAARAPGHDWGRYFPSRLVRLYVPVVAAILLAKATYLLWPRITDPASTWLAVAPRGYGFRAMIRDAVLLQGTTTSVTTLWSLRWEVLFSLLLPVYVVLARRLSLAWGLVLAVATAAFGVVAQDDAIQFLPMFAVGAVLAAHWDEWGGRLRAQSARAQAAWGLVTLAGVGLLTSRWLFPGYLSFSEYQFAAVRAAQVAGAGLLVVGVLAWRPLGALLSSRFFRWAGAVSFSLYLVHEPIIKAAGFAFPDSRVAVALAVVVALIVAQAFFLAVERPAHRLSRRMRAAPAPSH